jgi:hypothetical protein
MQTTTGWTLGTHRSRTVQRLALLEILTLSLGSAIGRALLKSWIGDHEVLGAVSDDVAQLLKKAGLGFAERRRLERELSQVCDRVATQLEPFFSSERFGGLPSNEQEAAAIAVATTVDRGFTSARIAFEADLDAARLEELLRAHTPAAAQDALLSGLGTKLYDVALAETCSYLVQMVGDLPDFAGRAAAELLARDRRLFELLSEALDNVPRTDENLALEFATKYRRAVARELDRVELFGVSVSEASKRYALSVAYITLSTSVEDAGDGQLLQVDELLARTPRALVRGPAGSGKTTLLQWLAVNAARRTFSGSLEDLNGSFPFFIRLRRFANRSLPKPAEFIDEVAGALSGYLPPRWVEDQLARGRALVLIDGVDEIPKAQRPEVSRWLTQLCAEFPDARYVVTSRPPAVDETLTLPERFSGSELAQMGLREIDAFISHWHAAARTEVLEDAGRDALEASEKGLRGALRQSPPLRRLATNPLLCAVICALHRDGRATLPRGRIELYRMAMGALLDKRDAQRRVPVSQELGLSTGQKQILLEDLAYWLAVNGYSDAPRDVALARIGETLPRIDRSLAASDVFDYLLERTGVLREPVVGRIDFVHRTFLEYLAAAHAVRSYSLGVLVGNAHEDRWSEIVVLACGLATPRDRATLVGRLLQRGHDEPQFRERLHLLAAAGVESAPELEPELREKVARTLATLVPPRTLGAAIELSSAGELAVPLLGARPKMLATRARASVRALGLIGSDSALDQLASYGTDTRVTVVRELKRQWRNFDTEEYAKVVMANVDPGEVRQRGFIASIAARTSAAESTPGSTGATR